MEEDEGIIVPLMKTNPSSSSSSHIPPQLPNLYNRSHNSYYHPPNPAYAPSVYSTTVNNPPIALMNYFNATNRMPLPSCPENPVVENSFLQQQLHVDMVITHFFLILYTFTFITTLFYHIFSGSFTS